MQPLLLVECFACKSASVYAIYLN